MTEQDLENYKKLVEQLDFNPKDKFKELSQGMQGIMNILDILTEINGNFYEQWQIVQNEDEYIVTIIHGWDQRPTNVSDGSIFGEFLSTITITKKNIASLCFYLGRLEIPVKGPERRYSIVEEKPSCESYYSMTTPHNVKYQKKDVYKEIISKISEQELLQLGPGIEQKARELKELKGTRKNIECSLSSFHDDLDDLSLGFSKRRGIRGRK